MWSRTWRAWSRSRRSRSAVGGRRPRRDRPRAAPWHPPPPSSRPGAARRGRDGAVRRRHHARLLLEVAVVEHSRHLHDAPKLDLAPAPAHARRAERLDQVAGLGLEPVLGLGHRLDLLEQGGVRAGARQLDLAAACRPPARASRGSGGPARPPPSGARPGRRRAERCRSPSLVSASCRKLSLFRRSASALSAANASRARARSAAPPPQGEPRDERAEGRTGQQRDQQSPASRSSERAPRLSSPAARAASAVMSRVGSPSTATRSASRPGATRPSRVVEVEASSRCRWWRRAGRRAGLMPYSTISSSSRTFSPCGNTPTSPPKQIVTPAASAALKLARLAHEARRSARRAP